MNDVTRVFRIGALAWATASAGLLVQAQTSSVAIVEAGPATISPTGQLNLKIQVTNTGNGAWSPLATWDCPSLALSSSGTCITYPDYYGNYGLHVQVYRVVNGQAQLETVGAPTWLAHFPLGSADSTIQPGQTVYITRSVFANGLPEGEYVAIAYTVRNWVIAFGSQWLYNPEDGWAYSPKFYFRVASDITPPVLSMNGLLAGTCALWPPNGKMVSVGSISASDAGTGMESLDVAVSSPDPEATGADWAVSANADGSRSVELRAKRAGNSDGRSYLIQVKAKDKAGNTASISKTCTVAHDQGN